MCDEDLGVGMFLAFLVAVGLVIGLFFGGYFSKAETKNSFPTYILALSSSGVAVTNKELAVEDYELKTFSEFLIIVKVANLTQCYYDSGNTDLLHLRAEKLWIQYDGIYYEVRQ